MLYVSAGHNNNRKSKNYDSGAVGINGRTEADETVRIRDKVVSILRARGQKVITDTADESLGEYLARIKPGSGSVVCEFHFNAFNGSGSGTEVIVGADYDKFDFACAKEMARVASDILTLPLRGGDGVITETESARGRLGLMREMGTVILPEICFIDNTRDMAHYDANIDSLAHAYADILIKYENLLQ